VKVVDKVRTIAPPLHGFRVTRGDSETSRK
jgi:hypothetical protein